MFLSKQHLVHNFGADPGIAAFYVDRKVPEGNLYWKGRLLYLRPNPGYLFIPLICDLLRRLGVPQEQLVSDPFVTLFEEVLHSAAREEFGEISEDAHIRECYEKAERFARNKTWLHMMDEHFVKKQAALPYQPEPRALQRADAFLFALNALDIPGGREVEVCRYWYALISFFLVMDDVEDYEKDKAKNDQNTLLEWGSAADAVDKVRILLQEDIDTLQEINPRLGDYCRELMEKFEIPARLTALAAS